MWQAEKTITSPVTLGTACVALTLYGIATILWIYVLRFVPLNRAYPYMALSFPIVTLASYFIFAEKITIGVAAGITLITLGILISWLG